MELGGKSDIPGTWNVNSVLYFQNIALYLFSSLFP